ncbi:dihydroxy-acid dehydratase [Paenibacillus antri]|uniref:Dihydroxy-acid dehydratase n=1 Tax=Paenibacillus antri TaxID=2582848 RepID=A0A5R9GLA3_9BACL|nr:dihydroxy-acid dehydratase [Paenibacillus antri]TLS53873.1 dihydroxy-acid dehydratase [Paenibacillus antri]
MIVIPSPVNAYKHNVQGKANEPITVAGLLDRSRRELGEQFTGVPDWTLDRIYDRLEQNSPRVAIIGGSADHPAHILDHQTVSKAAITIWQAGGLPFYFSTPVLCDGTAQNNIGMSYSLQSRNAIAEMVVNQMEAHSYHGAFVIQGCDKQPLGVLSGLAHLDRLRRFRGEHPVFATFAPSHVLKGGTIPPELKLELRQLSEYALEQGYPDVAADIDDAMSYILQCSSNTSFQGVLQRAVDYKLLSEEEHKRIEKQLAVNTCDSKGGICAFHGTGNSSREITAGLGFVSPEVELLVAPPTLEQVRKSVNGLFSIFLRPECSVSELMKANIRNAIRIHSASGGSSNLVMHIVGAMIYAGYDFSLKDMEEILMEQPVPDLFDYSLTDGRDIFALAQQCCSGQIRGMETLIYELNRNGVSMDLDALTVTGQSWKERLSFEKGLSAEGVRENRIILSTPKRSFSGVDVLRGNFFDSAVVKISGMESKQLDRFDSKVSFVLYYENEEQANRELLNVKLIDNLKINRTLPMARLRQMAAFNAADPSYYEAMTDYDSLFDCMVEEGVMRLTVVISGQGPEAFGMPEMMTPMQHINADRRLRKLVTLISDGRYSGVTQGAAIGHMTPEALHGGGILYLEDADVLRLQLRNKQIILLDPNQFELGHIVPYSGDLQRDRGALGQSRIESIRLRQRSVAASNRLRDCSDASRGVVPMGVLKEAELSWK